MTTNNIIQKGRCMNFGECEKANAKEIIEVNIGEEFICPICKKPLLKVQEKSNKLLLFILIGVVLIGGGIAGFMFLAPTTADNIEADIEVTVKDSASVEAEEATTIDVASQTQPAEPAITAIPEEGLDLGYAVWTGTVKNDKPNGSNGRMVFKQRHRIDSRDEKQRFAEAGEYIIGEYMNGKLVQGQWHKKDGNIEFISIGQ